MTATICAYCRGEIIWHRDCDGSTLGPAQCTHVGDGTPICTEETSGKSGVIIQTLVSFRVS